MSGTSFDDVLLINPSRVSPATSDDVMQAEAELGVRMPAGYAAYVERLGEGALGHLVRVHHPAKLPALTLEWRERVKEYWFWEPSEAGVTQESLQHRGVVVADTFDGDELCFDPTDPETLFVLPRDEDVARRVGPGFIAAIDWILSGVLNPWVEGWTFEAWIDRADVRESLHGRPLIDASRALADLSQHSHVVELENRTTFFLPGISGRLSLYQEHDGATGVDLSYDEAADRQAVDVVLAAVRAA